MKSFFLGLLALCLVGVIQCQQYGYLQQRQLGQQFSLHGQPMFGLRSSLPIEAESGETGGQTSCPIPTDVDSVYGKIWQKPSLSMLALYLTLPYFSSARDVLNSASTDGITFLAPDNRAVLKTMSRVLMYLDKMVKIEPDNTKLSDVLDKLRSIYAFDLGFINQLEKSMPNSIVGLGDVITDAATLKSHQDFICKASSNYADLWQNQVQLSDKYVQKLVNNLMYHMIKGSLTSDKIPVGESFVNSMLVAENGLEQKFHFIKYTSQVDGKTRIMINLFSLPDKMLTTKVVEGDIGCSNGVIHVVDTVFGFPMKASKAMKIWGLNRVRKALKLTGLEDVLHQTSGVTLFVPADFAMDKFAFDSLPITSFISGKTGSFVESEWLNNVDVDSLRGVLPVHAVNGVYFSTDLKNLGGCLTSLANSSLCAHYVTPSGNQPSDIGGELVIGNAKVIIPNILIQNGVMHIIDNVLTKPGQSVSSAIHQGVRSTGYSWRNVPTTGMQHSAIHSFSGQRMGLYGAEHGEASQDVPMFPAAQIIPTFPSTQTVPIPSQNENIIPAQQISSARPVGSSLRMSRSY